MFEDIFMYLAGTTDIPNDLYNILIKRLAFLWARNQDFPCFEYGLSVTYREVPPPRKDKQIKGLK